LANLPAGRVVVFTRDMPPVVGRAEQAWRRRDVHAVHHPDALTVRTRAWITARRHAAGRWVVDTTRPARTWATTRMAAVGGWCAARGAALRERVTGHGGSAPVGPYAVAVVPPVPAPPSVLSSATSPDDGSEQGAQVLPFPPSPWARPDGHPQQQDRPEQSRGERGRRGQEQDGPQAGQPGGA
jgi:hypothetical protein